MSKTLDELKARQARYLNWLEQQDDALRKLRSTFADDQRIIENIISDYKLELADLDRAIAALEAPAQPVHPEAELRSVPGAEEEVRDQSDDWTPTLPDAELTVADLDKLATKASPEERAVMEGEPGGGVYAEPEIPEGFTKWEGVRGDWDGQDEDDFPVDDLCAGTLVEVRTRDGNRYADAAHTFVWEWKRNSTPEFNIIAYRILEAPAPEQPASVEIEPTTDLWQQGYDDRKNGFEPSLAEPDYLKGYEARKAVEDEQAATYEQAKFFAEGMMADADRHAQEPRSIVEKIGGLFKREKEEA